MHRSLLRSNSSRTRLIRPGSLVASPICRVVRATASGVRNSWDALAMNRACAVNAPSSLVSRSLKVSESSLISSAGPCTAIRSCRFAVEMRHACSVITWTLVRTRPVTHQASRPATIVITINATIHWISIVPSASLRCRAIASSTDADDGFVTGRAAPNWVTSKSVGENVPTLLITTRFWTYTIVMTTAPAARNTPVCRRVSRQRRVSRFSTPGRPSGNRRRAGCR